MASFYLQRFEPSMEDKWDDFVLNRSANGTFLQTRRFLNYHPKERFHDNSLLFLKGNEIIAVIPGNRTIKDNEKRFLSHSGSTFGGIVIHKDYLKVSVMEELFDYLHSYLQGEKITEAVFKQTSRLYSKANTELLDYYFFNRGYTASYELGYYADFSKYSPDLISSYSPSVRRHYKSAIKHELDFRELFSETEIGDFYSVLLDNYTKFNRNPVHTLIELIDLKKRHQETIRFFGVYFQGLLVAGSMVFDFHQKVFHTQYLATRQNYVDLYINEFMYTNLLETAQKNGFPVLSFGTATLEGGRILNYNLAQYKEQYGTNHYLNITYSRRFN